MSCTSGIVDLVELLSAAYLLEAFLRNLNLNLREGFTGVDVNWAELILMALGLRRPGLRGP